MVETSTIQKRPPSRDDVISEAAQLVDAIRERAPIAEEDRALPQASVEEFMEAGLTRILLPRSYGGYELGLDTWFDVVRTIAAADAAHGWCASLLIHHPHYVAQFPQAAQDVVWADGPDVAIAAPSMPVCKVTAADGGYRVSGQSPFASGITHSSWAIVGGFLPEPGPPQWAFFLVGPGQFEVQDTWHTVAMRGTGSNLVITDDVFVPAEHTLLVADMREGTSEGGALHSAPYYRAPWASYAGLTFLAPMLGAAQGALEYFRTWTATRTGPMGRSLAEAPNLQVRFARAASDLEAVELLLRRSIDVAQAPDPPTMELRARSARDFARSGEVLVKVVDELMALSGTAGFATTNPIQRVWRDVNFASRHISLNPELSFTHWGRLSFGLDRDPMQAIY